MTHTYIILEDNTVEMWVPGQPQTEPPTLRQSFNTFTGNAFATREEAEGWIINFIAEATKPAEEPTVE